ncbi:hypothetical protein Ae406Ps2_4255 [Pseudonocardia sp. Ae406_Ps2]|uniref:ketopantoate reductase family protein n=1 Tax=Pseudonocardia sp. Ae505_Ps2 TaxID=1885034 RepID=UPI0009682E40|nr:MULTISPECIES: 2-dehydropantoate 2-reductase N-terminal domain-containing protein [unclassified Pseudonocardia]OLL98036.1 hypothetical protein Ae331Ps2_1703c [Pseudonocardia sp. Ae331_Ps2]OLM04255.1 hypothetical protein Ae406Ps2_4255 [Pseudonocardia sp. Ae406_Ps2]OLM10910.1 hypothetical protein Ae505Ps2_1033c [Pseudonocardia sp. Ae505_Ps2]OLM25816.1 hypothetical protein Ae706Ps2_4249 [Pseudonocardia sp. Ae706_Ps2]
MTTPMRTLVLGAGATGGYLGARLLAAGREVTFLTRPATADRLSLEGCRSAGSTGRPTPTCSRPW